MSNPLTLNEFRKRFKVVNPLDLAAEERCKYYDPFVEEGDSRSEPLGIWSAADSNPSETARPQRALPSVPPARKPRSLRGSILADQGGIAAGLECKQQKLQKRKEPKEKNYAACI